MDTQPKPAGRPPKEAKPAESQLQFRVQTKRKAAYVKAAHRDNKTLTDWALAHLDAVSGYKPAE